MTAALKAILRIAWAFALLCAILSPAQAAGRLPLKDGQYISEARAALLRQGWRPVRTFLKISKFFRHAFGDAGGLYRHGYPEVEGCTGIGRNYCFFNYTRKHRCLRVETEGEFLPEDDDQPAVMFWSYECPPSRWP